MTVSSTRTTDWIELSSTTGTANDTALTAASAKAPKIAVPVTDETNGFFVFGTVANTITGGAVRYVVTFATQDAANETFGARVWGWTKIGTLYIPELLIDTDNVAGARVGIAASTIDNTWFFPDTIVIADDNTIGSSGEVHDSGADGLESFSFDPSGHSYIEVEVSCETVAAFARCFYRAV
tara:strand:+ start:1433 stop:1975 length:543 start_codon:yes stop_codon:yes gene_type:complete